MSTQCCAHVRSTRRVRSSLFLGTAREFTRGRRSVSLDYECYPEMAEAELQKLESEARRRWPLVEVCIVHRVGHLELGEVSVAIAVSSAHRAGGVRGRAVADRHHQAGRANLEERELGGRDGTVGASRRRTRDSSPP